MDFGIREMFAFGIHNLGNFCLWNLVSWTLEQNTAQGIRNPSSITEAGIQ